MILRESLTLVVPRRRAGLAAAYGASRLIATMLFGLSPDRSADLRRVAR